MFDWMFEKKMKVDIYCEPKTYDELFNHEWEILEIAAKHESMKEYINLKLLNTVTKNFYHDVITNVSCGIILEQPTKFTIEVWESAYWEIMDLDWVANKKLFRQTEEYKKFKEQTEKMEREVIEGLKKQIEEEKKNGNEFTRIIEKTKRALNRW